MISIKNLSGRKINENFLKKSGQSVLEKEGRGEKILSVAFLKEKEMAKINKKYRGKSGATDVLSFEGESEEIGDIAICPKKVFGNAKKYGINKEEEILRVLVHGILHLLGYSHEDNKKNALIMEKKQEDMLSFLLNTAK